MLKILNRVSLTKPNQNMKAIKIVLGISFILLIQACTGTKSAVTETATQADIQELFDNLNSNTTLNLKNKIYYLDKPIVISDKSNFVLNGNGCKLIMKDKQEDVIYVRSSNNITLKNFKATHIEPEGPIGCTGSVIQVYNNQNINIENCELNGSGIIGVVAYNTKNLNVANNYIYNNSKYGVLYDTECSVELTGNKFEDNGDDGNYHVGMALDGGLSQVEKIEGNKNQDGLKMSNNTFK